MSTEDEDRPDLLIGFLEGELDEDERERVEAELEAPGLAGERLEAYRGLSSLLAELEPPAPSAEARDRAYAAVLSAMASADAPAEGAPTGRPLASSEDEAASDQDALSAAPRGRLLRFLSTTAAAALVLVSALFYLRGLEDSGRGRNYESARAPDSIRVQEEPTGQAAPPAPREELPGAPKARPAKANRERVAEDFAADGLEPEAPGESASEAKEWLAEAEEDAQSLARLQRGSAAKAGDKGPLSAQVLADSLEKQPTPELAGGPGAGGPGAEGPGAGEPGRGGEAAKKTRRRSFGQAERRAEPEADALPAEDEPRPTASPRQRPGRRGGSSRAKAPRDEAPEAEAEDDKDSAAGADGQLAKRGYEGGRRRGLAPGSTQPQQGAGGGGGGGGAEPQAPTLTGKKSREDLRVLDEATQGEREGVGRKLKDPRSLDEEGVAKARPLQSARPLQPAWIVRRGELRVLYVLDAKGLTSAGIPSSQSPARSRVAETSPPAARVTALQVFPKTLSAERRALNFKDLDVRDDLLAIARAELAAGEREEARRKELEREEAEPGDEHANRARGGQQGTPQSEPEADSDSGSEGSRRVPEAKRSKAGKAKAKGRPGGQPKKRASALEAKEGQSGEGGADAEPPSAPATPAPLPRPGKERAALVLRLLGTLEKSEPAEAARLRRALRLAEERQRVLRTR